MTTTPSYAPVMHPPQVYRDSNKGLAVIQANDVVYLIFEKVGFLLFGAMDDANLKKDAEKSPKPMINAGHGLSSHKKPSRSIFCHISDGEWGGQIHMTSPLVSGAHPLTSLLNASLLSTSLSIQV